MEHLEFVAAETILRILNRVRSEKTFERLVRKSRYSNESVKPEERQFLFNESLRRFLAGHIDGWLHTGYHGDGSETPYQRSLAKTEKTRRAVESYLESHPFQVVARLDDGINLSITPPPEPSKSAAVGTSWARIEAQSKERADFLFVAMLASGWKHGLYKCRLCKRYQVLKKPRRRYKYKMFCRPHHQAWSARGLTKRRRQTAKDALRLRTAVPAADTP